MRALNPHHQAARDQRPVTRPGPVSCVGMNLHIEEESSEASKVFIRRKKSPVRVDRRTGRLRERVAPAWLFESLLWGISSGFPLASRLALPGSESVFGRTQGPPLCACASLSQDGF